MYTCAACESNSGIGENSNSHSDVSSNNGSNTTSEEGSGSIWEIGWSNLGLDFKEIYGTS